MAIQYCNYCDKHIDLDTDVDHFLVDKDEFECTRDEEENRTNN